MNGAAAGASTEKIDRGAQQAVECFMLGAIEENRTEVVGEMDVRPFETCKPSDQPVGSTSGFASRKVGEKSGSKLMTSPPFHVRLISKCASGRGDAGGRSVRRANG